MELHNLNESDFYKIIKGHGKLMIDFSADWCADCREVDDILSEFAAENPGLKIYRLDVEENTDIANRYGVINVPSLLVFENSAVTGKAEGRLTKEELSELVCQFDN